MMRPVAIAIADAARARVFTFTRLDDDAPLALHERADLVSPERRVRPRELWTDARPRGNPNPSGHGDPVDDHREDHLAEVDRRFAAEVVQQLAAVADATGAVRVALVASPRFLGHLREHAGPLYQRGLTVEEVARDLTREDPRELRAHLGQLGVLPV